MKHKVGDKVKVREDLIVDETYDDIYFVEKMEMYKGKEVTINEVYAYNYKIEEDNGRWSWVNDMFEEEPRKIRGFEKISQEQFNKDFQGLNITYEDIMLPKRGSKWSAGYDIFAPIDIILQPNEDIKIPTGIRAYMQPTEVLLALPRSGHGFKYYLRLANTEGVIDSDYRLSDNEGHIFIKLRNEGNKTLTIKKGEGMFQAIFMPYLLADGDNTEDGETRNGGFGSTNNK